MATPTPEYLHRIEALRREIEDRFMRKLINQPPTVFDPTPLPQPHSAAKVVTNTTTRGNGEPVRMVCINRSDIPSRYLKPFTQWLWVNLPQVGEPLDKGAREARAQAGWTAYSPAHRDGKSRYEYGDKWVRPLPIKAFAYRVKQNGPAEEGDADVPIVNYRVPGDPRKPGERGEPHHLNIYCPRSVAQSDTRTEDYLADLKLRFYQIAIMAGAALTYFGREPLPGGPMPLHRQRIGKLWMENGDTLLRSWRKNVNENGDTAPNA